MEFFIKNRPILIFLLLISLASFLVSPKIGLADDFENITSEELSKYLELPEKDANKLMDTLRQVFITEGILAWSSGDTTEEKIAVAITLLKVVGMQALSHLLVDAPLEIIQKIINTALNIVQIYINPAVGLEKLEKLSVEKAIEEGKKQLFQNEIRVTPGAIKFKYYSYKGGEKEIVLQYVMIYKPERNEKRAEVIIRFYMPNPIEAPDAEKYKKGITSLPMPDLKKDLPPFIVEVSGRVEKDEQLGNYWWIDEKGRRVTEGPEPTLIQPTVKITFPPEVPDLGIKPLSWWEKYILKPIETTIKDIEIIITKVTGRSMGLVEIWEEIKSFILKITNLSPATIVETPAPEIERLPEIITGTVGVEPPQSSQQPPGIEAVEVEPLQSQRQLTLEEIQEILDDIAERIDVISVDVAKLTGKEIVGGEEETLAKEEIEEPETEEPEESEKIVEEESEEMEEEGVGQEVGQKLCEKVVGNYPARNRVIINEIAWMGTVISSDDEWIELKNISANEINLTGWQLLDKDKQIKIVFTDKNRVYANGFYLLERTSDDSVIDIRADLIYSGALSNTNEALYLFNENCQLQDEVIANPNWPAGDNTSKRTMERKSDLTWQTSANPGGTPKMENSSGYYEYSGGGGGGALPPPTPQFFPVVINEIMYDLEGSDEDREWIEILNNGENSVDLTNWKFYENETNHNLKLIQGTISIPPNGYTIIADDTEKFLMDHPNYSGTLFDSAFSLSNSGEKIAIKNGDLIINEVTYESAWGANGDGNSLQKFDNQWLTVPPTPGRKNEIPPPILEVSTTTLNFEAIEDVKEPASQSLIIQNSGGSNLNWQISPSESWLNFDPSEGSISPHSSSTVNISIDISELATGNYSTTFNIEAAGAQNSPKQISVNLIIYKKRFAQNVVISEIRASGQEEFVELYNPTDEEINMSNWYFSYFSSGNDWNNPWQSKQFLATSTIASSSYFLIALGDYPEVNGNPDPDWKPYKINLSDESGSIGIFSCNPGEGGESCKIDAVGWGQTLVKEGDAASPAPAGKSLGRKIAIDEGNLNYLDLDNNRLDFGIQTPTPGEQNENLPPVAKFNFSPENPHVGDNILFDASFSFDPDGNISLFVWDFGDENFSTASSKITKFFSKSGDFTISLSVVDDLRATSTPVITQISVSRRDPLSIVINEISWMGTKASFSDEWIEFYNNTDENIDIINWSISGAKTKSCLNFSNGDGFSTTTILRENFLIYAKRRESIATSIGQSIVDIWDDKIEMADASPGQLILYDVPNCQGDLIDVVGEENGGWFSGNSSNFISMERINSNALGTDSSNWANNNLITRNGLSAPDENDLRYNINGTPRAENSVSKSETEIFGSLPFDEFSEITLAYPGNPYIIQNNLTIPATNTLIIKPGVILKFKENAGLEIQGTLKAIGEEGNKIIFTSFSPPNYWQGIYFNSFFSTNSELNWTEIKYGKKGVGESPAILVENSSITFKNSILENYSDRGIKLINSSSTIENITFLGSGISTSTVGIEIENGSPTIRNCQIKDNKHGIFIELLTEDDLPIIEENNFEGNENPIYALSPNIIFEANQGINNEKNGILIFGNISQNLTWFKNEIRYIIGEPISGTTVSIESGVVLTINSGVRVEFGNGSALIINGTILAQGTFSENIIFTAYPEQAPWRGIYFSPSSADSILENTIISYGGGYFSGGSIFVDGSSIEFLNSISTHSHEAGIYLNNSTSIIKNSHFANNQFGIKIYGDKCPQIENLTFENNTFKKLYCQPICPNVCSQICSAGTSCDVGNILCE